MSQNDAMKVVKVKEKENIEHNANLSQNDAMKAVVEHYASKSQDEISKEVIISMA